jgi:hypothetical protein
MRTVYVVDRADRIVSVEGDWDSFALENGGATACAAHVVGGRLVDAIAGDPARMFITAILMRVRASGQAETVPYRCDSDRVRRYYTMTLTPLSGGRVRVEHEPDGEEPGAVRVRIRPAAKGRPAPLRCSICCRVREGAGEAAAWRDPFEGEADRDLRVIHTVCDDCKREPMSGFRARRRPAPAPRPD